MTYNPTKRDSSWHMIQPGCYVDPVGIAHIFPDEMLALLQHLNPEAGFDPCSKSDYDLVVKYCLHFIKQQNPDAVVRIADHERIYS